MTSQILSNGGALFLKPAGVRTRTSAQTVVRATCNPERSAGDVNVSRRELATLCGTLAAASVLGSGSPTNAVQGLTAGRIPGVTEMPDAGGFYTYTRPEGKSGGHGVGWSEIPRYSFKIPEGWEEEPVSIADLGGTEIDLRFGNKSEGELQVVVAPVLRFLDVGFNANVRIKEVGSPDKLISGFAPELFGHPLEDEDVVNTEIISKGDLDYYMWEVKPHNLVAATAVGNRVFLLAVTATGRQWRRAGDSLKTIQSSFFVPDLG